MDSYNRPARAGSHHRHISRRKFFAGAAAVSAGAVVGSQLPTVAHAAETGGLHGAELRGMYLTSKNRLAEGRFGLMFKRLPAFAPPDELLDSLASKMVEPDTSDTFLATSSRLFAGSRSSGNSSTTTSPWTPHRSISSRKTPMRPPTSGRRAMT